MKNTLLMVGAMLAAIPSIAHAKTITLYTDTSAFTRGYIEESDDEPWGNAGCGGPRVGPYSVTKDGAGDGDIGLHTGSSDFPFEDVRGNWEFVLPSAILRPNTTARLKFLAINSQGSSSAEFCVLGYKGNGIIETGDYQLFDGIGVGWFTTDGFDVDLGLEYFHLGDFDITALVKSFKPGGNDDFLGIQIAMDNFDDSNIVVWDIRLEINVIPEPAALAIFGLGLAGLGTLRRRGDG